MKNDALGDRMKAYENISRIYLTRRMPMIIRIDGKAFHSFTRGFDRPFDSIFRRAMQETAQLLCENIMGCKLAYVQSDEISLLITDYDQLNTDPWFGKNLQKIVSVAASMATLYFNKSFEDIAIYELQKIDGESYVNDFLQKYVDKFNKAMFDARAFILPESEVCNYFIWRQQDAIRNSIQAVGQAYFSDKELDHKTQKDILQMLIDQKNVDWHTDFMQSERFGTCVAKTLEVPLPEGGLRKKWHADIFIPLFTECRDYIEQWL